MTIVQKRSQATGSPVAEVIEKPQCYCGRNFTVDEMKSFYGIRKLFSAKNCPLPEEEKTFEKLTEYLNNAMNYFDINTCLRKAHFLAQIEVESDHFGTTLEYASGLKYDISTYENGFNKYKLYLSNKKKYSNYSNYRKEYDEYNKILRYGNLNKGDGPKYKGRGLIQLTWRNNYQKFFNSLGKPEFIDNPDIVSSSLKMACFSAGWFWKFGSRPRDLNLAADRDDLIYISVGINGGNNGFLDRKDNIKKLINLMGIKSICINLNIDNVGIYRIKDSLIINKRNKDRYEKLFKAYDD